MDRLASLPPTFLHGEFYASNVIVPERAGEQRVCPIDWELAAVGPALLDLAALVTGGWEQEQRNAIAGAYWDALTAPELVAGSSQEFREALDCALLHLVRAVARLGRGLDPARRAPPRLARRGHSHCAAAGPGLLLLSCDAE